MTRLKDPKIFSLKKARETLPFVKRIVGDVVEAHKELGNLNNKIRMTNDIQERRRKIFYRDLLKQRLQECQQELDLVGCHLKNPSLGIVGYYWDPGNGAVVELCWRYGDEDISYWQNIGQNKMLPLDKSPLLGK